MKVTGVQKIPPARLFRREAKTEESRCFPSKILVPLFPCNFSLAWNPLPGRQSSAVIKKTGSGDVGTSVYRAFHFLAV